MCGPPAGAPPGASWSGCTGLRTPVPTPAGTRGPIPPRSVGVCAGTRNGDEFLVLSWPEDAELGTSGAASLKEDTPCLIRARPLAQVQSLGQTLCAHGHTYLSASVEVLGVPADDLCWGSAPPRLGPRLTAPQGGALLPAWGLAGHQAGRQLLCGWRPLPATRVTRRAPAPGGVCPLALERLRLSPLVQAAGASRLAPLSPPVLPGSTVSSRPCGFPGPCGFRQRALPPCAQRRGCRSEAGSLTSASLRGALASVASFRALPLNSQGDLRLLSLLLRGPSLIGSGPSLL